MAEQTNKAGGLSEQAAQTSAGLSEQADPAGEAAKTEITPEIQAIIDAKVAEATGKAKSDTSSEWGKKLSEARKETARLLEENDARIRALEAQLNASGDYTKKIVDTFVAPDDQPKVKAEADVHQQLAKAKAMEQQYAIAAQKAYIAQELIKRGIPEDHPLIAGKLFPSKDAFDMAIVAAENQIKADKMSAEIEAFKAKMTGSTESDKKAAEKAAMTTAAQSGAGVGVTSGPPKGAVDWTKVDRDTYRREYARQKSATGHPVD